MIRIAVCAAILLGLAEVVCASPTFARELSPATITTFTGNAGTSPRGLAVSADGSAWYLFEDNTIDSILRWQGSALSVYASRAQIESALGITGVTLLDMTVDPTSGVLYAVVLPASPGTHERLIRIPSAGVIADAVSTLNSEGIDSLDVDTVGSRVVFTRIAFNGASAGEVGLWSVPLGSTNAVPTLIAAGATIAAALTPSGAAFVPSDVVARPNGEFILCNAGSTAVDGSDGDLVRVTAAGAAFAFADRALPLAALGNASGTFGDTFLECDATGAILLWHNGGPTPGEGLILGSANGATWTLLASEATMLGFAAFMGATDVGANSNGIARPTDGRLGIAQASAGSEGIVIASDLTVAAVSDWSAME